MGFRHGRNRPVEPRHYRCLRCEGGTPDAAGTKSPGPVTPGRERYCRQVLVDPEVALASYSKLRSRLSELLSDITDEPAASTTVPACPEWSVTDTVAHLTGVCLDIVEGNLDGVGTAPWADRQVARYSGLGLGGLLGRWAEVGPVVESLGSAFPRPAASQFVFDATTHEHDIRGALGRAGARSSDSLQVGLGFIGFALDSFVRSTDVPALAITSPNWSALAGEPPAEMTLEAPTFELFRAFGGRRSTEQFLAMDWSGDATPFLAMFDGSPLQLRAEPLAE